MTFLTKEIDVQIKLTAGAFVFLGCLSGCATGPSFSAHTIGETQMVVTSAGANVSTVRVVDGREIACVRLGPDAATDVSGEFSLSLISNGSEGDGYGDQEVELIGRTPTNILVRDLLFQLCTYRQSGLLTDNQYQAYLDLVIKKGFELSKLEMQNMTLDIKSQSAGFAAVPLPSITTNETVNDGESSDTSSDTSESDVSQPSF